MLHVLFSRTFLFSSLFLLTPFVVQAQEVHQDFKEVIRAEVVEVISETERPIMGTDAVARVQRSTIEFLEGERKGEVVVLENEVVTLRAGDEIFVNRVVTIDGYEYITYFDYERRSSLIFLALIFVALLLFFSRWQGVRALLSLAASIGAILFLLVPALLAGYNPALTTVVIAGIVMALVLFGTHGINARSVIAFGGTFSTVAVTGLIAFLSVEHMKLTGFSHDASVYLNFATDGQLDLAGLMLGSIVIGILGVLDDVSITQASVVQELKSANPKLGLKDLYGRAIKVGRDHIGSLVNTLALAYAGVSLPLILLYAKTESDIWLSLNQEVIAVELLRIIVGSIGLILAVPVTTFVAAWYFQDKVVLDEDTKPHHHH